MPRDVHLNVLLPKNRDHLGTIRVEVDGVPTAEFRVLGRGSSTVGGKSTGNPQRDPFKYAGNTPTGDYVSPGIVATDRWNASSYGPWGAIRLKAVAGDALLAEQVFHRSGFLIHGGSPGRFSGYNPTLGCLRVSNDDMRSLIGLITDLQDNPVAQRCEMVSIRITVRE